MCPSSGISYPDPQPNLFSFNSPYGACEKCNGLGFTSEFNLDKIIPDHSKSIKEGGIDPLGTYKQSWMFELIEEILKKHKLTLDSKISSI